MLKAALAALLSTAAVAGGAGASDDTYHVAGGDPACSDAGPGSVARPWCSLGKARSGPEGATVLVRSVRDGDRVLLLQGRTDLTVRAHPGERPVLDDVVIEGSTGVTVSGLTIRGTAPDVGEVYVKRSQDIVLDDLHLDRAHFRSRGTDRLTIQRSVVENGAHYDEATAAGIFCGCGVWAGEESDVPTRNITVRNSRFVNMAGDGIHLNDVVGSLVEGNSFHTSHPYETEDHVDTIQVLKGADHVIRGNEAYEWQHGILTTDDAPQDGPDPDDRAMIVQNNLVHTSGNPGEARSGGYAFNGAPGPNSLIVNNTWTGSESNLAKGAIVRWTVGSRPGTTTSAGTLFANNLVDGTCAGCDDDWLAVAANHVAADVRFDAGYELPAGSPAINAADPAHAPALDLRGRARNGPPDVGALEYRGIRRGPGEPGCETTCDERTAGSPRRGTDPGRGDCGLAVPALADIRRALRADRKRAIRALRRRGIDGLLEHGRFAIRGFDALSAGTLRVTLRARTARARRAAARKRMLAKAKRSFARPGTYRVKVELTRKGRRILRRSRKRTATLALAFSDPCGRTVRRSKQVTLRR